MTRTHDSGLRLLGLGAVACAVCCAGPILAFLGGIGMLGLASTFFLGWLGVLVAAAAIAASLIVRRRRTSCPQSGATVKIAAPTARTPQTTERR
jgi:hypothetical protein